MIYYKAILKYEYYIRIMKTTIFKIVRLGAIRDFLVNKKGSIHDMLEHVNSKIHELDGESVGIRTIEKDLKKLKSEKNFEIKRYRPSSSDLQAIYGTKTEKQYSHMKDSVNLSKVLFFKLGEGYDFSDKLSLVFFFFLEPLRFLLFILLNVINLFLNFKGTNKYHRFLYTIYPLFLYLSLIVVLLEISSLSA